MEHSVSFSAYEILIGFPIFLSLGLLGFFALSIFVFLMTGKSLLFRANEWVNKNQPDEVQEVQYFERNADYILAVDEVMSELPDLLRQFKADYRDGMYPNMQKELVTQERHPHWINPLPLMTAGQFGDIKLGRRFEPQRWKDYPIFYLEIKGEIHFLDPYILDDFKLWPLILKGFYEEPPFDTLSKVGKYAHPI